MGGHQVGYGRMEYLRVEGDLRCESGLPLHAKMEKLDFTCRGFEKRACENGKVGFCMSELGEACM